MLISLNEILNTFKYNNIELNDEDNSKIASIFSSVDKFNDKTKEYDLQGDGYLNSKEYYLFFKQINESKNLLEKFNKIRDKGQIAYHEKYNDLSVIFSTDDDVDEEFLSKLNNDEKMTLINGISISRDLYGPNCCKKIKNLFEMQFSMIKEQGGYTKDLEELLDGLLETHSDLKKKMTTFDDLKAHVKARLSMLDNQDEDVIKDANGEIDLDFKQGKLFGDCWVLASIKAIACDKIGLEKLNNMISVQRKDDNLISVTVNLQGKDYVISAEELYSAIEYSTGDMDVRALEIAINRYCVEHDYGDITSMGGQVGQAMSILLDSPEEVNAVMHKKPWLFSLETDTEEKLRTENVVGTVGAANDEKYAIDAETGEKVKIYTNHLYTITSGDNEWAYLYNPHDTSRRLKIKIDDIRSTFNKGSLKNIC